jgi:hypothetical protein
LWPRGHCGLRHTFINESIMCAARSFRIVPCVVSGMRIGSAAFCIAAAGLWSAGRAEAQSFTARVGVGPAVAEDAGGAALLAFELHRSTLVLRAEGSGVLTGRSADWEGSARVIGFAGGIGFAAPPAARAIRPYALARVGVGLDAREADEVISVGASAGVASRSGRLFAELRYDNWSQRGVSHHDLPRHVIAIVGGVAFP